MKKVLFSLSLLASLASFAADEIDADAQIFGVLPLTTSNQSVIISVPWVSTGYGDSDISVSNLIRTANLTVGDALRSWDKTKNIFNVWELKEEGGVKYWSGVTVVGTNGTSTTESAAVLTLARGKGAVILMRKDKPSANYTIYINGQVTSSDAVIGPLSMARGTTNAPAYTLIAPPYSSRAADLNTDATWIGLTKTGDVVGDRIYLGENANESVGGHVYYKGSTKGWGSQHNVWTKASPIKPGVGVWYVSRGDEDVTLTWKKEFKD